MKAQFLMTTLFSFFVMGCSSNIAVKPSTTLQNQDALAKDNPALIQAMSTYIGDQTDFDATLFDLNQDGLKDAVVLLKGSNWCGSGGCTMLVFKALPNDQFQPHSKLTVTDRPIYVLPNQTQGWRDLSVYTGGTGQVLLKFNGISYPSNPSLAPRYTETLYQNGNKALLR